MPCAYFLARLPCTSLWDSLGPNIRVSGLVLVLTCVKIDFAICQRMKQYNKLTIRLEFRVFFCFTRT